MYSTYSSLSADCGELRIDPFNRLLPGHCIGGLPRGHGLFDLLDGKLTFLFFIRGPIDPGFRHPSSVGQEVGEDGDAAAFMTHSEWFTFGFTVDGLPAHHFFS